MEVKSGYKKTEVGVIPEDWDVKQLREFSVIATGNTPPTRDPANYGDEFLFVSPVDLGERKQVTITEKRLSKKGFAISRHFPKDAILFVCIGSTIGKCGIASIELTSNQQINAIFPSPTFRADYLYYFICSIAPKIKALAGEQAVPIVNKTHFSETAVALPPIPEQHAIAEVLGDVDALLGALEKLIAKKRDLKQAAMQQLLTGKKRLPGFRGEWEVKTLGDLFNFSGGFSASRDQLSSKGHCYLHYGDIHGATKTFVDARADYQSIPKLDMPLKRVASKSLLEDGDVVFVDASEDDEGTSRHVVVVNKDKKPFISGLHTMVGKSKTDELAHEYRRYCFQTAAIRKQFLFYAVGTKVSGISKTNIAKLVL
ncbi:MAG: restriction endonuclease subunit S, partial [Verrucomicrobia bacterium]|nr:restriction endonuclease subunit S [Verrucomicrobiota bacterium]